MIFYIDFSFIVIYILLLRMYLAFIRLQCLSGDRNIIRNDNVYYELTPMRDAIWSICMVDLCFNVDSEPLMVKANLQSRFKDFISSIYERQRIA